MAKDRERGKVAQEPSDKYHPRSQFPSSDSIEVMYMSCVPLFCSEGRPLDCAVVVEKGGRKLPLLLQYVFAITASESRVCTF